MPSRRILFLALATLVILSLLVASFVLPRFFDATTNVVLPDRLISVGVAADTLHASLKVVDLHDDLLLWNRDPLEEHAHGHSDVPRLLKGRTAVQVFSAVTKSPRGLNYDSNTGDSDNITLLAILQRWPPRTWGSRLQRALYQARKLAQAAARSHDSLTIVRSAADLEAFLAKPNAGSGALAGILAIEGLHALDGRLGNLDTLYAAGFRIMGLTHFFDNEVGASAHGVSKGGLTETGRAVVRRMQELHIIADLAHLAPAGVAEVLDMASRPVVVSHSGVQATCPGPRNLSDDQIRAIAANGGLIGIGYWDGAVCEPGARSTARAIRHVAALVGVQHAALGSDFDGATKVPFDAANLAQMTQALREEGFSEGEIADIMGGNALRFLRANLPAR
jgi:microsomal dipeptidase-like Zn-dependent dipeptidase